jgi:tetratricopeptide (TPR) repeat protein
MAAQKALELDPNSAEVLLALGYYHLWANRDIVSALKVWERAEKLLPNDTRILIAKASILELKGDFDEAIQMIERAYTYSPRDSDLPSSLALYYWFQRDYVRADTYCDRAIALAPNENWPYLYKAFNIWSWKGANEESKHALEAVNPEYHWLPWAWFWQDIGMGKYDQALSRLANFKDDWIRNKMWAMPKPMMQAMVYDFQGQGEKALPKYNIAVELLESELNQWPEDPRYASSLALVLARLGKKERALQLGRRAVDLLPVSEDAIYSLSAEENLIRIYLLVGDEKAAINKIETLLKWPSWITLNYLKIIQLYDVFKDNPHFIAMLEKYKQQN